MIKTDSQNIVEILSIVKENKQMLTAIGQNLPEIGGALNDLNENVKTLIALCANGGGADLAKALQQLTESVQNMSSEVSDLKNVIREKIS